MRSTREVDGSGASNRRLVCVRSAAPAMLPVAGAAAAADAPALLCRAEPTAAVGDRSSPWPQGCTWNESGAGDSVVSWHEAMSDEWPCAAAAASGCGASDAQAI